MKKVFRLICLNYFAMFVYVAIQRPLRCAKQFKKVKRLGWVFCTFQGQGPSIKDVEIFQSGGGSQIPMLQDIRSQVNQGQNSVMGEGVIKNGPKNSDVFYGRPLVGNNRHVIAHSSGHHGPHLTQTDLASTGHQGSSSFRPL